MLIQFAELIVILIFYGNFFFLFLNDRSGKEANSLPGAHLLTPGRTSIANGLIQQVTGQSMQNVANSVQHAPTALDVASLNAALNNALTNQATLKIPGISSSAFSNMQMPDRRRFSTATSLLIEDENANNAAAAAAAAAVAAVVNNGIINGSSESSTSNPGINSSGLSQLAAAVAAAANANNSSVVASNNNNESGMSSNANADSALPVSSVPVEAGGSTAMAANALIIEQLKIQAADMPLHMQKFAIQSAANALQLYTTEKHIAESIKQDFDSEYQPTWHCIVGRNWGSCVTHSKQCYIRMLHKELTILLYKSS